MIIYQVYSSWHGVELVQSGVQVGNYGCKLESQEWGAEPVKSFRVSGYLFNVECRLSYNKQQRLVDLKPCVKPSKAYVPFHTVHTVTDMCCLSGSFFLSTGILQKRTS